MHCGSEECGDIRVFRTAQKSIYFHNTITVQSLNYLCSNCRKTAKYYAIAGIDNEPDYYLAKLGELPRLEPPTPNSLLNTLGDTKPLFLNGRRCELLGMGIGAFTYYRRVLEGLTSTLISKSIQIAELTSSNTSVIDQLKEAQGIARFKDSLKTAGDAIPDALKINGESPLELLYKALSDGLHNNNDSDCLEIAHDIRLILIETSTRIKNAVSDDREIKAAIERLKKRHRDS
ncbi:MAG: hypothetical protein Phyf2KO_21080 [Phycisphaerales bacterium]